MNINFSMEASFLKLTITQFKQQKALADKAIAQLNDKDLLIEPKEDANSIAIVMKHLSGNMISRWTDFLTTDGEKANRNRDEEFEVATNAGEKEIEDLKQQWEKGWNVLFSALESLNENDLQKTITIRSEEHSVMQALIRQISHYAYHVGQIVLLAKILKGKEFQSLSIPKNKSKEFNSTMNHK